MKKIIPFNTIGGGNISPTITAHYHKAGYSDFYPDNKVVAHLAIMEIETKEPKVIQVGSIHPERKWGDNVKNQDRIYDVNGIAPTLCTCGGGNLEPKILIPIRTETANNQFGDFAREPIHGLARTLKADNHNVVLYNFHIRKLTPRECFRLMDMDDADIDKIDAYRIKKTLKDGTVKEKPIPKSQKYKLAGNSIVVSCLYHIFKGMFIDEKPKLPPKQLDLFDDLWQKN